MNWYLKIRSFFKKKFPNNKFLQRYFGLIAFILIGIITLFIGNHVNEFWQRLIILSAIYVVMAVGYNFSNGVAGQFSLDPNAYAAIGAYIAALLTMSPETKENVFILEPVMKPFDKIQLPFLLATIIGGIAAAFSAFLIGIPSFRVRGDYLAIITFGFGEIINVITNNWISLTNGALGLKGIPEYTTLAWAIGWAIFSVFFLWHLTNSQVGRILKSIREDEVAAEATGINVFRWKLFAFTLSGFFIGVGGALFAHYLTTISPQVFTFFLTFNLLIIILIGGLGSIVGSAIAAVLFTFAFEVLRVLEEGIHIGSLEIPPIPGLRMIIFAILLIVLMIFRPQGIFGDKEVSIK